MYKYLFGPVPSRRLGRSLGIDLVPKKVCSLNCVYCEVGKTTKLTTERKEYVLYERIVAELDDFMKSQPNIDYITFSGSGEPTLNTHIGKLLRYIKNHYPKIKTAILSNGTLFFDKELRQELLIADVILPSLDAASQRVFEKIDRPAPGLKIETYIQGLIDLRKEYKGQLWLEILFLKFYNTSKKELLLLKEAIRRIQPDRVQLNTLDRPGTVKNLTPLNHQELLHCQQIIDYPNTEIIAEPVQRKNLETYHQDIEHSILNTITRRPCTLYDLQQMLGIHINEINKYLGVLEESGKIKTQTQKRGTFYLLA